MKYRLVISSASQQDLSDALMYYPDISPPLAEKFLQTLETCYNQLEEHPQHYSFFGSSTTLRSLAFKTFPFSLIFKSKVIKSMVVGLHNHRQNPENILKRE